MVIKIMFVLYVLLFVSGISKRIKQLKENDWNYKKYAKSETLDYLKNMNVIKTVNIPLFGINIIIGTAMFLYCMLFLPLYFYCFVNFPIMKTLIVLQLLTVGMSFYNLFKTNELAFNNEEEKLTKFFEDYKFEIMFNGILDIIFIVSYLKMTGVI